MKIIFTYCQRRSQVWGFFMRCKRQSGSAKQGGRERISVMVIPPREGSSNKYEAPNERQNNELWSAIPRIEKKRFNEKITPLSFGIPACICSSTKRENDQGKMICEGMAYFKSRYLFTNPKLASFGNSAIICRDILKDDECNMTLSPTTFLTLPVLHIYPSNRLPPYAMKQFWRRSEKTSDAANITVSMMLASIFYVIFLSIYLNCGWSGLLLYQGKETVFQVVVLYERKKVSRHIYSHFLTFVVLINSLRALFIAYCWGECCLAT